MSYTAVIALRWGDMDAYGHVNNVTYLQYLEEARVACFEAWFPAENPVDLGVVVARSEIEYAAPLEHRTAPVLVDVWVSAVKGASFDLDYVVRDPQEDGGRVYARATSTLVMYDLDAGEPRRVTGSHRAILEDQLGEPVALRSRR